VCILRAHDLHLHCARDNRLVNWSCTLKTALSDIEVDNVEISGSTMLPDPNGPVKKLPGHSGVKAYEFGVLVEFAYKFVDSEDEIVVATTRIETMLGDTAVAVHPDDPRYKKSHGKFLRHPFFPDRRLPLILDGELVDMSFGTGAVKITPAHDPNDFKAGKKNNLEFITILDENGAIAENGGEFAGMMRYDARNAVIARLQELVRCVSFFPRPFTLGRHLVD
jgi:valyl-tRNA synthetase